MFAFFRRTKSERKANRSKAPFCRPRLEQLEVRLTPASLFGDPINYAVGFGPVSVAKGDFNADGKIDLAVANRGSSSVSILLGDGAGSFSAQPGFSAGYPGPRSEVVGDFNGDGNLDLAIGGGTGIEGFVGIFLGNGAGAFSAQTTYSLGVTGEIAIAAGDFNGDGKLDLAVVTQGQQGQGMFILEGDGAGGFSVTNNGSPTGQFAVTVGDFNGDGNLDLAVVNHNDSNVSILLGNGAGSFSAQPSFATGLNPTSVAVGDFNRDGKLDLAITNFTSSNVSILLGDGTGGFSSPPSNFAVGTHPWSVAIGDFDRDGILDLAVPNAGSNNLTVLLGDGLGSFGSASSYLVGSDPQAVAMGDFDNNGGVDLAVANWGSNNVTVLLNQQAAAITTTTTLASSANPSMLGQSVTFTVTVSNASGTAGAPTGSVEFFIDHASVGAIGLTTSGTATYTTAALSAGSHTISAVYAGHGDFLASSSAPFAQTTLTRGQQFTFDQEGGIRLLPYHPTQESGVTIGVGYDMGQKSTGEIFADLTKAGVDEKTANALAGAAWLTGEQADQFVENNPGLAITTEQANSLFLNIYRAMEADVMRIVDGPAVVKKYGKTDWANLNQAIKDILVDMRYRGDYTGKVRSYVQSYVVANDLPGFIKAMSDKSIFPGNLSKTRFNARLDYLRHS